MKQALQRVTRGRRVTGRVWPVFLAVALLLTGCASADRPPVASAAGTGPSSGSSAAAPPGPATTQPEPAGPTTPSGGPAQGWVPTPSLASAQPVSQPSGPVKPVPAGATPGAPGTAAIPRRRLPEVVRGIHLSGWVAGSKDLADGILVWARKAGINTMVLDLKAEDGKISWKSDVALAEAIGANTPKIGDFPALIQRLHQEGFWVVGRVVCFQDPVLYRNRPEFRVPGFDGQGYSFVRPMDPEVQQYQIDIARSAVQAGVDEIQFDYIRFSEKLVAGYNLDTTAQFRTAAINAFLKTAVATLKPMGALVSADVFGLTTSVAEGDDMQIGQDYRQIAEIVDFVSPMMYPSHYARGTYGIDDPDAHPYETVNRSMAKALERTAGIPLSKHRPWIQDFTYPAPRYMAYGKAELEAQVRALRELGVQNFLLWDPGNKYPRHTDLAFRE